MKTQPPGREKQDAASQDRERKLQSLLELGHLIGLDLELEGMLLHIAQKAAEVMNADRCSVFLHDPKTNELWSTVAMGMAGKVIRIPSSAGLAGACFQTGEVIHVDDAYQDARFNRDVDVRTGYRTRSLLCLPLYSRAGRRLGVIQVLNKSGGVFTEEDAAFLETFANHASIFIEMAQLQKARLEALEESRKELDLLNRVKDRILHHLSHEMKTPLAIILGTLRVLKGKILKSSLRAEVNTPFERLEKHLDRLLMIQQEADEIVRSYHISVQESSGNDPTAGIGGDQQGSSLEEVNLFHGAQEALRAAKQKAGHREIRFFLEGDEDHRVLTDSKKLQQVLQGLLKNAIENTPDEGEIRIRVEQTDDAIRISVRDFGIGIQEEHLRFIFDGLFTTQETDLYTSKNPYDFGAGGKGLDLLRMKVSGQRLGFRLFAESQRCVHLRGDRDLCPGKVSRCPHCLKANDCTTSGGSVFFVSFPALKMK